MGLIEDLKSLEELHARGRLTDDEFATAKAAALATSKSTSATAASAAVATAPAVIVPPGQKKGLKTVTLVTRLIGVAVILIVAWVWIQQNTGDKSASTLFKEAVRMPVDLKEETFGIPAASWKAIGIQTPYDGSLTISVQITRGNPMQMFLTDSAGLEQLKSSRQGTYIGGFYSVKGTSFQHSERIRQGVYYFVVWDRSLGILSSSSSDVTLRAQIDP